MEKSSRRETSFSSMILDEVCCSMDGNDEKVYQERSTWAQKICQSNISSGCRAEKAVSAVPDEQIAGHEMDCRVEEGMEKQEVHDKVSSGINLSTLLQLDDHCPPLFGTASSSSSNSSSAELPSSHMEKQEINDKVSSGRNLSTLLQLDDHCPPFFGTASSSSSNSSSAELPSSHIEFFPLAKPRKSRLATTGRPKPVRARVSPGWERKSTLPMGHSRGKKSNTKGEYLIKSKSRARKVYAKKMKVHVSPGGRRFKRFIRKLFVCQHYMKITNKMICFGGDVERKPERSTEASSTSSSASSFPNCNNAAKRRRVTFDPVSVIVDEDGRPCGHKFIDDQNPDKFVGPPIPLPQKEKGFKTTYDDDQDEKKDTLKMGTKGVEDENVDEGKVGRVDGDEDDAARDCRWDLLETDHLAFVGIWEELPDSETSDRGNQLPLKLIPYWLQSRIP